MTEFDAFRQALAASLLASADRSRRCADGVAVDREAVWLRERLAADVWNLDRHVFLLLRLLLTHRHLARRFADRSERLLEQVGPRVRPADCTALLRWMIRQTLEDDPAFRRTAYPSGASRAPVAPLRIGHIEDARSGLSEYARGAGPETSYDSQHLRP